MGPLRFTFAAAAAVALASCAALPPAAPGRSALATATEPAVTLSPDGRTAHMRLDVVTYNIEGLGWPAREGRAAQLAEIGRRLATLRAAGEGPDVVVFQEVFSGSARDAVAEAGYPASVAGPGQWKRRQMPSDGRVPGSRNWRDGELGVRLASSGLVIASRFPVVAHHAEPYSHRACAGFDCLSNKGVLFARLAIPGLPEPLDVFDTHMNSRHKSGAPLTRTAAAHAVESRELADTVAALSDAAHPVLVAGDLNMRHSPARFGAFEAAAPLNVALRDCAGAAAGCQMRVAYPASAQPWLETEDQQLFRSGRGVDIRPVRIETLFDGGPSGPMLSDHAALRVVYELSWRVDGAAASQVAAAN